jgi:hypothetical protein
MMIPTWRLSIIKSPPRDVCKAVDSDDLCNWLRRMDKFHTSNYGMWDLVPWYDSAADRIDRETAMRIVI